MEANGISGGTAEAAARRPPHVAMLVTPGRGHLTPLAELAKRLAARHGVTATLITFASTASATQRAFLASLPPGISSLSLPPVDLSDLPPDASIEMLMSEECVRLMHELALGLELSGQRFLWVVRSPSDEGAVNANYYDAESKKDPLAYLPAGFVERTKGVGLLVPSWAPQTEVLAHDATGCFLVHCGWNSVLESLVHGVPMVAWPLFAEQRQNAVRLSQGVGAAVRVPATKKKEEIAAAVREVMAGPGKGAEVRAKVATLQKAAIEGLLEGGAAMAALDEVASKWTGAEHA
uniref:Hydroquinone glucosyltransferase n=1 Tax=Aegilops tauschii TaxID=37682 RepID=M8B6C7_AEGTA